MGEYAIKLVLSKTYGVKVLVNHDDIIHKPLNFKPKTENNLDELFKLAPKIS